MELQSIQTCIHIQEGHNTITMAIPLKQKNRYIRIKFMQQYHYFLIEIDLLYTTLETIQIDNIMHQIQYYGPLNEKKKVRSLPTAYQYHFSSYLSSLFSE